jgi:hypothetical protein
MLPEAPARSPKVLNRGTIVSVLADLPMMNGRPHGVDMCANIYAA